uniref:Uncharacterized protein n=1 Tax=Anguilla anguilla TaxID=7936 RepID=A0A0E9VT30_ANGAN
MILVPLNKIVFCFKGAVPLCLTLMYCFYSFGR